MGFIRYYLSLSAVRVFCYFLIVQKQAVKADLPLESFKGSLELFSYQDAMVVTSDELRGNFLN